MPDLTRIKIFIASSGELEKERKEGVEIFVRLNKLFPTLHLEPVLFELDIPSGNYPGKERIQDEINPLLDSSDIVVVLFYSKVGKFTREELDRAVKQGKKVFLYFKDGFSTRDKTLNAKYSEVLELQEEIEKESAIMHKLFTTDSDYYRFLYEDMNKYLSLQYPQQESKSETTSSSSQYLPLAPRPYLAHPYALPQNFTGRSEEMRQLTEWLKFEQEPMCIVEAIGGMGKSALTWRWLQEEVIANTLPLEGIVWWSFYDQGFDDFIHHLYEYCVPENRRKQQVRIDELTEVITALANHRFLLVLDGFERVLRGYAQMMAMYQQEGNLFKTEDVKEVNDIIQRTPISPKAEKLLKALCAVKSKTLMTTRLFPATIEGLAGIKHLELTGLSKTDTIAFFKAEGINGGDEEMVRAGAIYNYHPLMLKQLSTAINRTFKRSIDRVFSNAFAEGLINEKEPQKILTTSFNLLNKEEQKVATTLSVFRTAFKMDAASALFPKMEAEQLEAIMRELCNLGFVMYNTQQQTFDFHPIMRSYLYDSLTAKDAVHNLALSYFSTLPPKEKIITLADLEPVIEQYHHLISAKKYDKAYNLFHERLLEGLYYKLAQYDLMISLLQQLFAKPGDELPALGERRAKSNVLNELGLCYANSGQLDIASRYWFGGVQIDNKGNDNGQLAIGLRNISELIFAFNSVFAVSLCILLKGLQLLGVKESFYRAYNEDLIADVLSKQDLLRESPGDNPSPTISYYEGALKYFENNKGYALASFTCTGLASFYLNKAAEQVSSAKNFNKSFEYGLQSLYFAEKQRITFFAAPFYFLRAYCAISRCLLVCVHYEMKIARQKNGVYFYDEHFLEITERITITGDNYLFIAERIVNEGLTLSRKINRVFYESYFLLLLAQTEWLKIRDKESGIGHFTEVIKAAEETHILARKIGHRINLADLHLFCAECLIEMKELQLSDINTLLNLTAQQHLVKAREYARDMSEYSDLFLPPDGSADEFYKGIPEYEMLKRGMTEEERVKNGYYVAWLKAERLEKRI